MAFLASFQETYHKQIGMFYLLLTSRILFDKHHYQNVRYILEVFYSTGLTDVDVTHFTE